MTIVPRSGWGARQPESVTLRSPRTLEGVVVHWFGSPRAARRHKDCPALLRSVQRTHQAGEYSDIAYNHAVCPHGTIYELRGFGVQTGANGNGEVNRRFAAVVAMIGEGDKPTEKLLDGLSDIIGRWRLAGAGKKVRTHGSITGSECPGPHLTAWVKAGGYEKRPKPKPEPRYDLDGPKGGAILRNVTLKAALAWIDRFPRRFPSVTLRRRK